jgi:hypothetical protein
VKYFGKKNDFFSAHAHVHVQKSLLLRMGLRVLLHEGICVELGMVMSLSRRIFPVCTLLTDDDNFDRMTPLPWRRYNKGKTNSRCLLVLL